MTVAELLSRASSRELTEWMVFAQLEPFGTEANNISVAVPVTQLANTQRRKNHKGYKVDDFMPKFERRKEADIGQAVAFAEMITLGLGGKDLRE